MPPTNGAGLVIAGEQAEGVLVIQRKCGSCRHFRPGETGASGECGHPDRRALLGLVMVRAQELHCRRGLNEDEWEAAVAIRATEGETAARQRVPAANGSAGAASAPDATPVKQPAASAASRPNGETKHTTPAGANGQPVGEPTAGVPAPCDAENPGAADSVRRRTGYQGAPTNVQIGGVSRPSYRELNTDGIPIQRRHSTVAEIHTRAKGRARPPRETAPLAEAEPAATAAGAPAAATDARPVETAPLARPGQAAAPAGQATGVGASSSARVTTRPTPAASAAPTQGAERVQPDPEPRRVAAQPTTGANRAASGGRQTTPSAAARPNPPAPSPDAPSPAVPPPSAAPPVNHAAPRHWAPPAASAPPSEPSTELETSLREWREEWREAELAEHPERRCASCRDFRAAETPGRGWCVNPHAFPTRQLVGGEDLACLSGLGSWWIESDDFWKSKAGVSPSRPTPLADGLIQILKEKRRGYRRS
jgi:hypothetical protein